MVLCNITRLLQYKNKTKIKGGAELCHTQNSKNKTTPKIKMTPKIKTTPKMKAAPKIKTNNIRIDDPKNKTNNKRLS